MGELLPSARLDVAIESGLGGAADDSRTITIRALDPTLARYLEAAA